jgi:hypothetical protein
MALLVSMLTMIKGLMFSGALFICCALYHGLISYVEGVVISNALVDRHATLCAGVLFGMQVCMHIWVELAAGEMIWSLWHTPLCFY